MPLSRNQEDPPGHHRRDRFYSDAHGIVDYTTSNSPNSFYHTRAATDNFSNVVMSPNIEKNIISHPPQSPAERITSVKNYPHNHRHHHGNRPRSKSESETHHRSPCKKKGTLSPGGHSRSVQSPISVSPSPKYRSLGKMWIRPVPVKNLRQQQGLLDSQQGLSESPPTIPLFPEFESPSSSTGLSVLIPTTFPPKGQVDDMMLYTTPNSSLDAFQRNSESNPHSSSKAVFAFGESGKPLTPFSLAKRSSPTSVVHPHS